ncbi:hypothetical protein E4U03_04725 [Rothia nasimurium]|uniref:Uncharacterized protein n=1 Tax=Rothia nasimurium TaxID=85336 RepID=A0A4Y9F4L4_9MICC|nr:hypothetical protein [Rothia nasimurium]MBF0807922.1 hypothetical protein [Rothia nasimurium]TFU22924.1 hypothetical protein E4U03_04725 [Rothia nasimurium]
MRTIDVSDQGKLSHSQVYQEFTRHINGQDDLTIITRTVHTTRDEHPEPLRTDRYGLNFTKIEGQDAYKVAAVWERDNMDGTGTPWQSITEWEAQHFGRGPEPSPSTIEVHEYPGATAYHWAEQLKPHLDLIEARAGKDMY